MKKSKRNYRLLSETALCLALMMAGGAAQAAIRDDGPLNRGDVLIGPGGVPGAIGPTGVNDDYTNLSISTGIANIPYGGVTTAGGTVVFRNTIQNTGGDDDVFIISAPETASGFKVEISIDGGDNYSTLGPAHPSVLLPLAYRAAAIVMARITAPAGLLVLRGFDTVICAASTATPTAANKTIDRLYTGFIRLDESATVVNANGIRGSGAATPGSQIEFTITYANVSSVAGVGNSLLTAHNLVIRENGNAGSNNWGQTTEHIVGASDNQGGTIIGDYAGSTSLTDLVTSLEAGQSGVFKFKRRIK